MNTKLKNKVLKQINDLKTYAEQVADNNLKRALNNAQFNDVYSQIRQLNFNIAKKEFLNKPTSEDKKLLKTCEAKQEEILKKLNLTKQDLLPKYSCKLCEDTGVVGDKFCKCFYEKLNKEIIANIGINICEGHTFENANFTLFDNGEKIKNIYKKIENWCDKIQETKYKNLLLCGDTGVGKTYIVESICNKLIKKEMVVNYYTAFALNDLFLKYRTTFSENKSGILDDVLNCDVLIIDDLGTEPNIKNTEEYFYLLFNERMIKNKTTIVTTNLNLDQIMLRYGERTFSRLVNKTSSLLIKIENSDLRLKK